MSGAANHFKRIHDRLFEEDRRSNRDEGDEAAKDRADRDDQHRRQQQWTPARKDPTN